MASLSEFARRIRVLAMRVETGTNALVIKTAGAVDQTVVLATPVDTGRARANWQVGIGSPVKQATDETDPNGQPTISRNGSRISSRKAGDTIYLSNNVAYIGYLNQGSSAQAPAGFVEQAVAQAVRTIHSTRVLR